MESDRHTCLKLELPSGHGPIFVKGTWFNSHFHLSITDGLHAWTCHATEAEVGLRAEQWDQPVLDYLALVERYLGVQQPGSCYSFEDAGNGSRRLSWTFEKQGTKLEWRWKCQPSSDDKQTTAQILDFLMDANVRLSETYTSSMSQKYGSDESNHPEFDPEAWCDAIGGRGTTRTHFYGFGITPRGKNFASTTINAEDASYSACSRPNVEHEQTPVEVDNLREEVSLVKDRIINLEDKVEKQASDTADIKKYLEQMMEMFNPARMFTNASMGPSQPPT